MAAADIAPFCSSAAFYSYFIVTSLFHIKSSSFKAYLGASSSSAVSDYCEEELLALSTSNSVEDAPAFSLFLNGELAAAFGLMAAAETRGNTF